MDESPSDGVHPVADTIEERRQLFEEGRIEASIVIPVNQAIPVKQRVLTDQQVRDILNRSEAVALTGCDCRNAEGNCDSPIDVCIVVGETAQAISEKEGWTKISVEEALAILDRTAEHGLVHLTLWDEGHEPWAICSCCSCCCHELRALIEFGYSDQVIKSDFIAEHDADACGMCGNCVDACHFGAFSETEEGVVLDQGRCFGCGVCVLSCPSDAISLADR
jgi:NAD-dependent dihydropyrimidine dehydrogenase PreA subunit